MLTDDTLISLCDTWRGHDNEKITLLKTLQKIPNYLVTGGNKSKLFMLKQKVPLACCATIAPLQQLLYTECLAYTELM